MLTQVEKIAAFLEGEIRDFADIAVVGISGGIDSAVVASACVAALGEKNVYLISMPYDEVDRSTFNLRSTELAEKLGAHHLVVPISKATDSCVSALKLELGKVHSNWGELHRLTAGNTRSRVRMTILYGVAGEISYRFEEEAKHQTLDPVRGEVVGARRVRVMGTGNASEDLIGYDTKGGDSLGDLFILGDLFKSEVYQLAQYYEVPSSIRKAAPSAGLYEGQTDADELGYTYEQLEPALSALHSALARGVADDDLLATLPEFRELEESLAKFVIRRFVANAHKHRAPKVAQLRHLEFVKDIWSKNK